MRDIVLQTAGGINAATYGVVGNGITDDSDALEAWINAAIVRANASGSRGARLFLPGGAYRVIRELHIAEPGGAFIFLSLEGESAISTRINFSGPAVCLRLTRAKFFRISNLAIYNVGTLKASGTVGLKLDNSSTGTGTSTGIVEMLAVDGFETGIQLGDGTAQSATSEVEWVQVTVSRAATGILVNAFNVYGMNFRMLQLAQCDVGMDVQVASGFINVWGGNGTQNVHEFRLGGANLFQIAGWRSEQLSGHFIDRFNGSAAEGKLLLFNDSVASSTSADGVCVALTGGASSVSIISSEFFGSIQLGGSNSTGSHLSVVNVDVTSATPITVAPAANVWTYRLENVRRISSPGRIVQDWFADEEGAVVDGTRVPYRSVPRVRSETPPYQYSPGVGIDAALGSGPRIQSADGSWWRLAVGDDGTVNTTKLP